MMDSNKWTDSLPKIYQKRDFTKDKLDPEIWINTLPKTKKKNNSLKKYSLILSTFVIGLVLVSIIKNETRNLQKELDSLSTSINLLKLELHQVTLDHEVITSPENISRLAKENLETDLIIYKKAQIKELEKDRGLLVNLRKKKLENYSNKKEKKLKEKIKLKVAKKIEVKKVELKKLQELYSKPEKLPSELKLQVAKKIEKTKVDLEKLYNNPKGAFETGKMQRWAAVQVVKVLVGMPIIGSGFCGGKGVGGVLVGDPGGVPGGGVGRCGGGT